LPVPGLVEWGARGKTLLCALIAAACVALALAPAARGSTKSSTPYELWDDFSAPILNPLHWNPYLGLHTPASYEVDVPTADQFDSSGLHIVANQLSPTNIVTSGGIRSNASFLYGHFDVIARLPVGKGAWPGIWLFEFDSQGQMNGEIDMLEGFGSHPSRFQSTIHHWSNGKEPPPDCVLVGWIRTTRCYDRPPVAAQDFHVAYHDYGLDWEPGRITFLLDGVPYYTSTYDIPNVPMQLVVSMAVGSGWDGYPDATTTYPIVFDVRKVTVTPL
jgi:beta-glucanase (GH16 family)